MLSHAGKWARRVRRSISRSEWTIRLLRLPVVQGAVCSPGLLMVQIDGLSRRRCAQAMHEGRMPFLRWLIRTQRYTLHPVYSGLPASTPAFQAELFYGVPTAVPAFSFLDKPSGRVFVMYRPRDAAELEQRLAKDNEPLLRDGAAYTNILTGGASEPHYCAAGTAWGRLLRTLNPLLLPVLALLFLDRIVVTAILIASEMLLGALDALRGVITGKTLWHEMTFALNRAAMVILLRELVVLGAKIDLARGLPVIYVNFVGYDEQAHRRGPSSRFARWALPGIDGAIRRLWGTAHWSGHRAYDTWVLSDHGQEDTQPYSAAYGKPLAKAVKEAFEAVVPDSHWPPAPAPGGRREAWRTLRHGQSLGPVCAPERMEQDVIDPQRVVLTAMGSLGHVYPPRPLSTEERGRLAQALVEQANVPIVLASDGPGTALAWTPAGALRLPEQIAQLMGPEHPYLHEVGHDLVRVCEHESAGALVLSGWRREGRSISFPVEHGSHTGPGLEETNAFALLPADAPLPLRRQPYLRAMHLREAVLRTLGRFVEHELPGPRLVAPTKTLRVMTYNVHSCIGMDGKLSPERIARVIARHDPDVVALQELDVGRPRTGIVDQAQVIAHRLRMALHFHPSLQLAEERYGNAVLSRYPMELIRAGKLPSWRTWPDTEPRGAMWVRVDVHGTPVQLVNSHLSIWPRERLLQVGTLLGSEWLTHPSCGGPVVLCGDLNATPNSRVCRRLGAVLQDAQRALESHRPLRTWSGWYPVSRIDHVFVGPSVDVVRIDVPNTNLERAASDHLPLVVELRIDRCT